MGSPLVTRQAGRAFVLKLTDQRILPCNCIYQLRGSDITSLSCKQTVGQSQLGILGSWTIFLSRIERVPLGQQNRTILVADKFGQLLHDRRQIFVGRFYWQTKLANFIVRLTSALKFHCCSPKKHAKRSRSCACGDSLTLTPFSRACEMVEFLARETPDFIRPKLLNADMGNNLQLMLPPPPLLLTLLTSV